MKKILKKILKILLIAVIIIIAIIVILLVWSSYRKPSFDKNWQDDSKILPNITISDDNNLVTIKNLRDWRYEKDKVIPQNYYDDVFDIQKLNKAYLLFNPFGEWEGVGHSFFVFEFEDGKDVSISIEARREMGEAYRVELGVINEYEIWYAIGSSADFLTRRAIYNEEDLYMYPLLISKESARALFLDMSKTAEKLETTPGFYNTITSNCTNLLADSANRVKKGSIPFHYSRLFTGFADNQLYDLGYIPHDKPFKEVYKEARIYDQIRQAFINKNNYSKEEFFETLFKK